MKDHVFDELSNCIEEERVRVARRRRRRYWRRLGGAAGVLLLAALVFTFTIGFSAVVGQSMYPTLRQGDVAVYLRHAGGFAPQDIVVFRTEDGPDLIKRVIAVGGDTVDVDKSTGRITVNGMALSEAYAMSTGKHENSVKFPLTVPEGELFVLGDNRDVSMDSRNSELGTVSADEVRGRVLTALRTSF